MTQVESADRSLEEMVKERRAEIAGEARWYVLEAREGKDFSVCCLLAAAGFDVFRPVDKVSVTRRVMVGGVQKKQVFQKKVPRFNEFLFLRVKMTVWVREAVEQSPDVVGFIHSAGTEEPAVLPDALIDFYRERRVARPVEEVKIEAGDRVRITVGPSTGVIGVARFSRRRLITVDAVDGMKISTFVVPFEDLEIVEKARVVARGNRKSRRAQGRFPQHVDG